MVQKRRMYEEIRQHVKKTIIIEIKLFYSNNDGLFYVLSYSSYIVVDALEHEGHS